MSRSDVNVSSSGRAKNKVKSKNKDKNNDQVRKSNANEDEDDEKCPVTRSIKSFMQQWGEMHNGEKLSITNAAIYSNGFRSQRVHYYIASPMANIIEYATMCAKMLNILMRYDVNHILFLTFIDCAISGVQNETIIENTISDAAIEWAEMIVVKFLLIYLYFARIKSICNSFNCFVFCFVLNFL